MEKPLFAKDLLPKKANGELATSSGRLRRKPGQPWTMRFAPGELTPEMAERIAHTEVGGSRIVVVIENRER